MGYTIDADDRMVRCEIETPAKLIGNIKIVGLFGGIGSGAYNYWRIMCVKYDPEEYNDIRVDPKQLLQGIQQAINWMQ